MHKVGMLIHEATVVVVIAVIIDRVSTYTKQLGTTGHTGSCLTVYTWRSSVRPIAATIASCKHRIRQFN